MDGRLTVFALPCLADNYAYVVATEQSSAFVIDPSDEGPVKLLLRDRGLALAGILATHHHLDHVGGIAGLAASAPGVPVYAHASDRGRVPGQTHGLEDGVPFEVGGATVVPHHVPGHTLGAVAYAVGNALFTGDTLFVAGCGRLFEGTPGAMHASLSRLGALPASTHVYCGHEYTLKNLEFAAAVEPDNRSVAAKLDWARATRAAGKPTLPTTLGEELATNPFLRCHEPTLAARFGGGTPVEVFAAVRAAKDQFR